MTSYFFFLSKGEIWTQRQTRIEGKQYKETETQRELHVKIKE